MKYAFTVFIVAMVALLQSCNGNKNAETQNNQIDTTKRVEAGKYCNTQHGFCIVYPPQILIAQTETADGQTFIGADEKGKLAVYLGNLDKKFTEGADIKAAYDADIKPVRKREVTYQSFGTTFYVLMGYEGTEIFYQKTILSNGKLATAILRYDTKSKEVYYPLIETMFKSFK